MIQEDINTQMNQYLGNMQRQGISPETYYKITNTTEDQLRSQFAKDAEERVKTNLVLEAIVKKEGIKATKEEIDKEIKDLASEYNMDEKTVRNTLTDDMKNMSQMVAPLVAMVVVAVVLYLSLIAV